MTEKDLSKVKYGLRPFIAISALIFFISALALLPLIMIVDGDWQPERISLWFSSTGMVLLTVVLIFLFLSRKYLLDLQYKEVENLCFPLIEKDWTLDYEAGSGIPNRMNGGEMTPFNAFYIFCNGHSYRVDEFFYSVVEIGDLIWFSYAKRSKTRFSMYVKIDNTNVFNKIELF